MLTPLISLTYSPAGQVVACGYAGGYQRWCPLTDDDTTVYLQQRHLVEVEPRSEITQWGLYRLTALGRQQAEVVAAKTWMGTAASET